jgi:hypothetical protein
MQPLAPHARLAQSKPSLSSPLLDDPPQSFLDERANGRALTSGSLAGFVEETIGNLNGRLTDSSFKPEPTEWLSRLVHLTS